MDIQNNMVLYIIQYYLQIANYSFAIYFSNWYPSRIDTVKEEKLIMYVIGSCHHPKGAAMEQGANAS